MIYDTETENIYDDLSKSKETFDFSDYSAKSKYYNDSNALVIAKIKDEMGRVSSEEFAGLNPKLY